MLLMGVVSQYVNGPDRMDVQRLKTKTRTISMIVKNGATKYGDKEEF